jgi:hypothetical protein
MLKRSSMRYTEAVGCAEVFVQVREEEGEGGRGIWCRERRRKGPPDLPVRPFRTDTYAQ